MAVYTRDRLAPPERHPDLYEAFSNGYFVVKKSTNPFSMIGLDHNHEQGNRIISDNAGAVSLDDECVLTDFLIAGPERARVVDEFEKRMEDSDLGHGVGKHHESLCPKMLH